mmetsp:Transcript_39693/g.92943  ORF Transcript_39693/g.92943 Transcript_39693/m.92943 type:complete len:209 (+) Transcript_39693:1065-1691(+)
MFLHFVAGIVGPHPHLKHEGIHVPVSIGNGIVHESRVVVLAVPVPGLRIDGVHAGLHGVPGQQRQPGRGDPLATYRAGPIGLRQQRRGQPGAGTERTAVEGGSQGQESAGATSAGVVRRVPVVRRVLVVRAAAAVGRGAVVGAETVVRVREGSRIAGRFGKGGFDGRGSRGGAFLGRGGGTVALLRKEHGKQDEVPKEQFTIKFVRLP